MKGSRKDRFVPYTIVSPGYEGTYVVDTEAEAAARADEGPVRCLVDPSGVAYRQWPLWNWTGIEFEWDDEIKHINSMQEILGELDEETRKIRAHIASLAHCHGGFPVTCDALLDAIGTGSLSEPSFHNGCFLALGPRGSRPRSTETLTNIESILRRYLAGERKKELVAEYPDAEGFIQRTYQWLGPFDQLTDVQKLMLERMLLPFEWFSGRNPDIEEVHRNCFAEEGRGKELDDLIAKRAGLPEIHPDYAPEFQEDLANIESTAKKELYKICCGIAHGFHELSDCHHASFRWVEKWIHGIGTGNWDIPTRQAGSERRRLGRLLFGYSLGLDRWLLGTPMQFLLLDLGHLYLGFDPKNEIIRVYAYLGEEKTPVKEWLAACLWYHLQVALHRWGRYEDILDRGTQLGLSLREWMVRVQEED